MTIQWQNFLFDSAVWIVLNTTKSIFPFCDNYRCRAGFCVACGLVSSYFLILFGFVWVLLYCFWLSLFHLIQLWPLVPPFVNWYPFVFCLVASKVYDFDSTVCCLTLRCYANWRDANCTFAEIDLAVWCTAYSTLRRLTWWCDAHKEDWIGGVMQTVEIVSAGWCIPLRFWYILCSWGLTCSCCVMPTTEIDLQLLCDAHHGDWLAVAVWCTPRGLPYSCCVMHTTEIELDVGCTAQRLTWMCDVQHRDWLYKINGMHTAEFLEKFEYFNAIKKLFKNILACLAGAQMGSNHEWSIRLEKIKILKKYPNG